MSTQDDHAGELIARVLEYQDACNRGDVEQCVAMFTADGVIDDRGMVVRGQAAIRAAHEFDVAAGAQLAFADPVAERDTVRCTFVYSKELDRILSLDAYRQSARFMFHDSLISAFVLLGGDEAEEERHRSLKEPFFAWARQHFPVEVAKVRGFDRDGGAALTRLGRAWEQAGKSGRTSPPGTLQS